MRYNIKHYLLLILIIIPLNSILARENSYGSSIYIDNPAYQDSNLQNASAFLSITLPRLIVENRDLAPQEFLSNFEALKQISEKDILSTYNQLYSFDGNYITLDSLLVINPRYLEDVQTLFNLLLYSNIIDYLNMDDKQASKEYLQYLITQLNLGQYYPLYLYLWVDLVAENGTSTSAEEYINNYKTNYNWYHFDFKPSKASILSKLENLDLDRYIQYPSNEPFLQLESEIIEIENDLNLVYSELKTKTEIISPDFIDHIYTKDLNLLEDLKLELNAYLLPQLDNLDQLLQNNINPQMQPYEKYTDLALKLKDLKDNTTNITKLGEMFNNYLDQKLESFLREERTPNENDFKAIEMKYLLEMDKTISYYEDIISILDQLIANPDFAQWNDNLFELRVQYTKKLNKLQYRLNRNISKFKNSPNLDDAIFIEVWELINNFDELSKTYSEITSELDKTVVSFIQKRVQDEQKVLISEQLQMINDTVLNHPLLIANLNSLEQDLDFIDLILEYRDLRYQEQIHYAEAENKDEAVLKEEYDALISAKTSLLNQYEDYVKKHPQFEALHQPDGTYLLNNALFYYNMAELQYDIDLDHPNKALAYYKKVPEIDPDFYKKDYILYNIGYLSSESKKSALDIAIENYRKTNPYKDRPNNLKYTEQAFQEALDAYTELVDSDLYSSSPLYDEALYRLGSLYFLIGSDADVPINYYNEAIRRFDTLVSKPESDYYYHSLYQRGWVNLNLGDETALQSAILYFTKLIEAVDREAIEDPYLASDYKNNSIDNIAYALVALDGIDFISPAKGIQSFEEILVNYPDTIVKTEIIDKAVSLKMEINAPLQAIDYLELRLKVLPLDLKNPSIIDSIITIYHTPGLVLRDASDLTTICNAKYDFIKINYNNYSPWYERNIQNAELDDQNISKQLDVIRKAYEQIRVRYYNQLIDSADENDLQAYNKHLLEYKDYQELFKDSDDYITWQKEVQHTNINLYAYLAEKRDTPEDYYIAIQKINDYNETNPDNPDFLNNEGLSYKYSRKIYDYLAEEFKHSQYTTEPPLPTDQEELYNFYEAASLRFYNLLINSEDENERKNSIPILMDLATVALENGKVHIAQKYYQQLLNNKEQLNSPTIRTIYINLAKIAETTHNYSEAKNYYEKAKTYALNTQDSSELEHLIRLQLQNIYEEAELKDDYLKMAVTLEELANRFTEDQEQSNAYMYQASEAYKKAGDYQKAIDIKLQLAQIKKNIEDKFFFYNESWAIAYSLMQNHSYALQLQEEFIAMYPSSNQAFNLKIAMIEEMKSNPSQRETSADMYLQLYQDVRSGKIDSGNVPPEDIYLWAVNIYMEDHNQDKALELLSNFINTHPDYKKSFDILSYLADAYLAKGDEDNFEFYARKLYLKDHTQSERYLTIAKLKLGRLAKEFDEAYQHKDWKQAFQKRDEFKKLEAQYLKDGLPVKNEATYEAFAYAEAEYETEQNRKAYLDNFDRQLKAIENGELLTGSPNKLIPVNTQTTWRGSLFEKSPRYIPTLKKRAETESAKIIHLLEQPESDILDIDRRLKALCLIAKINEYTAEVIEIQLNKYFQISNEMAPFRDRKKYSEEEYNNLVYGQLMPYAQQFIEPLKATAIGIYLDIYNNYNVAGCINYYTKLAEMKLLEHNSLPNYQEISFPLNSNWNSHFLLPDGKIQKVNPNIESTMSPQDIQLFSLEIPAHNTLIMECEFTFKYPPEFAFLHLVYPDDPEIWLNENSIDLIYIPVDTLIASNFSAIHFAAKINNEFWKQGYNELKCIFPNKFDKPLTLYFNSNLFFNGDLIEEPNILRTKRIVSNTNWNAIIKVKESENEIRTKVINASSFNLPIDRSEFLTDTSIKAIWIEESSGHPYNNVIFETEFILDNEVLSAYLDTVAPELVTIYVNGTKIVNKLPLNYESFPFMVYPIRIEIPIQILKKGKNILQIEVQNNSPYRGMMAEINFNLSNTGE
jgi:tetratricopeptide (TPR) repeat protein